MRIHTIGHSTRSGEDFLALLREFGVRHVADVRRFPGSRRHPQFDGETLAAALGAAGIGYSHLPELGGRRSARPDSPNTAWDNSGFRGYADHMESAEFQAGLARLLEHAARSPVAIMCAEAVPWRCHRNLLADALAARTIDVIHILGPGQSQAHEMHASARVRADGSVHYPGGERQLGLL